MKRKFKKFLCVFLATLMITTVIPMGVYAAENEESETVQVSELENERDLYSKTYETSEGTNVVISAAVPLHYEKDGELKEIDNTLVKSDKDSSMLTNTANTYNVELPKKLTDDSQIKIDYDGNSISFKLLNSVRTSRGDIAETEEASIDETNAESIAYAESNMSSLSSGITYENILPDTDVEYNVEPTALKENIILTGIPDEGYSIQYELNTGGLEAVLNEDNSITLSDSEETDIFMLESPYMIDASENMSEDITVTLQEADNGYILTYVPNYTWLSNEDTEYPVTIDPTVTVLGSDSDAVNIEDTYVTNFYTDENYSEEDNVIIQNNEIEESYGYYKFNNLPELPYGSVITKGSLNLSLYCDSDNYNNETNNSIAVYTLSNEQTIENDFIDSITWDDSIDINSNIIETDTSIGNYGDAYIFDITNTLNTWYQDETLYRILMLSCLFEDSYSIQFASSNYYNEELIPYLTIEYTNTNGITDEAQYNIQDIGLAGTTYINDYTGNLIVERTDLSSNGTAGDLTFYTGSNCNVPKNSFFGTNTSMNYFKTLTIDTLNDNSEYIITNGDGSKINTSDLTNCSTSRKTIVENNITTSQILVSYSEDDNTILETFSSSSATSSLSDSEELYFLTNYCIKNDHAKTVESETEEDNYTHEVTIKYSNNHITLIQDEISQFTFSYAGNKLSKIRKRSLISDSAIISDNANNSTKDYSKNYSHNDTIEMVNYNAKDGTFEAAVEFDAFENVVKITNLFGEYYKYTYNDNNQVIKAQEFSANGTAGDYLTFEYGNNSTTISDGTNTYTEYFDLSGKLLSVIDEDGNATFAQYTGDLISKVSQTRNSARNIADFYSFESNTDSFFNTNSGTVALNQEEKFNGNSSVKLTAPALTEAVFSNKINNLEKNSTYTVSMWLYKDANTDCSLTLTNGDTSGIFTTVDSQVASGWQQFYCTIDTENSNFLNVALTVDNSESQGSAEIYVDNMYVQKSPYLTNINLLHNSDFSDNLTNWTTDSQNISVISEDANTSTEDNNRLKIEGDYLSANSISQTVSINAKSKGTKYTYGGWIKTVDTLPAKEGTNREISLAVYGIADDGTSTLLSKKEYSSYISNWQYIEEELSLPENNISQLKFVVSCNYQCGYVLLDGLSLSQDELYTVEFEYAEDGETITGIITNETTIPLTDDTESSEEETVVSSYEYDDYGNITKIQETYSTGETDSEGNVVTESIVSKFQYGNSGSLLIGEMSELGRWSQYLYDYFGNVASVTDANGNTVQYEYDNFQNLSAIVNQFEDRYIKYNDRNTGSEDTETSENSSTSIEPERYELRVEYTYTGNRLDSIETGYMENGEFVPVNTYVFAYDQWGNQTDIYINDSSLSNPYIHYEYDGTNYRQLNAVYYNNSQELHYVYDVEGNIIYEYDTDNADGNTLSYSYYYYDNGTCYGKKDLIAGTIESYQDGLTVVKDKENQILHKYGYDNQGNLFEQIGNNFIEESEDTSLSKLSTTVNNVENTVETTYDNAGRISSEIIRTENSQSYIEKHYTYYNSKDLYAMFNDNTEATVDDFSSILNEYLSGDTVSTIDADAGETNLIRFLTYYIVDSDGTKTKLNEYRYLYYVNGDTLSCTVVSGNESGINPGNSSDDVEGMKFFAYNDSGMELGNLITEDNINNYYGFLYQYDNQGNIKSVTKNKEEIGSPNIVFSYDSNSGTNVKNCLTSVSISDVFANEENPNLDFNFSYDARGNINNVSSTDISIDVNDSVNIDVNSVDLNWARGTTLNNIKGNINVDYTLPLINTEVTLPLSLNLIDYQYDGNNLRTHKHINYTFDAIENSNAIPNELLNLINFNEEEFDIADAEIDYVWRDGKLVGENITCSGSIFEEGDSQYGSGAGQYSIVILYDQNGNAYGFNINKTMNSQGETVSESNTFYYLKDADNTINAIIDSEGNKLVEYEYDSFGMVIGLDNAPGYRYLMLLNPLAYRDYVYDIESGMYYLQSRYYAPYIGRFISPDSLLDTGSGTAMCTSLYSYCENNPTNHVDPTGHISFSSAKTKVKNAIVRIVAVTTLLHYSKYYDIKIPKSKVVYVCDQISTITSVLGLISGVSSGITAVSAIVGIFTGGSTAKITATCGVICAASGIAAGYLGLVRSRISLHYNSTHKNIKLRVYKYGTFKVYTY